jgi:DNA-binding transcriptional ArsR family regulator
MAAQRKTFVMREARQLAALGSPVRCQIVDFLTAHGPSSVRELAARMGRVPESLYYHVRALADVGLVVVDAKRKVNRRTETVYRLIAPRLVIDRKQRSPAYLEALAGTCAALLRLTERNYRAALKRGGLTLEGPGRGLLVRRGTGSLTQRQLGQLNRLLDRAVDLFGTKRVTETDGNYALTIVLTPSPRGRGKVTG